MFALVAAATLATVAHAQQGPDLILNTCDPAKAAVQQWGPGPKTGNLILTATGKGQPMCMDIDNFNTKPGAEVYTWPCGQDGAGTNELWTVTASSIASQQTPVTCLSVTTPAIVGAQVTTDNCNPADPAQTLAWNSGTGLIVHTPTGLCVDGGTKVPPRLWCTLGNHSSWTICDQTASLDDRAKDIVSRLSLADKISSLDTGTPGLSSVGLPSYQWWSEATHGVSGPGTFYSSELPGASNTALPITTSCSFNRSLWWATGNHIAREGRAFRNNGQAAATFWTPVINIVRDPRWGRNIESAGEDPFVSGAYAANFVQGFEHSVETSYPLQASACCKHFVANELDAWNGTDRYHVDVFVPQQDLVDSYLPSFQTCVEEGKVSGIMCSYNAVNGVPSCASTWLLGTLLREEWQFDGYVTSDCDADSDVFNSHHFTKTPSEAVAKILQAGTDVDCGSFMGDHAGAAITDGNITESDIDTVLVRLFKVRIRLGYFDTAPTPLDSIGADNVCNPYSKELARDGVRQSVVLVKNAGNTLPLKVSAFSNPIIIGPNLDVTNMVEYYGGRPCGNNYTTPYDGLKERYPNALSVKGVPSVGSSDTSGVAAAATAAGAADVVFLSIGSNLDLESEGHDRLVIDFSDGQKALITAVTAAAKGPVVAIVQYGGAMDISSLLSNPKITAIFNVGQPSVQIPAVYDVIFGATLDGRPVAPAGRMSQMTYPADYVNQVSMFDFGMRPGPSAWPPGTTPGRTYRFYTGTPVLPFGYGLSYTTWVYTPLPDPAPPSAAAASAAVSATRRTIDLGGVEAAAKTHAARNVVGSIPKSLQTIAAEFWVNVTNSGSVDSDDVVLGFMTPPGAGTNGVPLQELFGFERVFVPAGQTVSVYLGAQGVRFTQADKEGVRQVLRGEYTVTFGLKETANLGMGFAQVSLMAL